MKNLNIFKKEIKTWILGSSPRKTPGGEKSFISATKGRNIFKGLGPCLRRDDGDIVKEEMLIEKEKGFTLVETLVAIFILVVSITGPMAAAQNSLRASFLARDQVVAYYLAQESIEYIKNAKDGLAVRGVDWKTLGKFPDCLSENNKQCDIDSLGNTKVCGVGSIEGDLKCKELNIDVSNGFFVPNSSGGNSKYIRSIFMNNVGDETEVTVVIEWRTNLFVVGSKRIVVSENIYDWIPIN